MLLNSILSLRIDKVQPVFRLNELSVSLKDVDVTFKNKNLIDIEALSAYMNDKIIILGMNGTSKSKWLRMNLVTSNDKYFVERGVDVIYHIEDRQLKK